MSNAVQKADSQLDLLCSPVDDSVKDKGGHNWKKVSPEDNKDWIKQEKRKKSEVLGFVITWWGHFQQQLTHRMHQSLCSSSKNKRMDPVRVIEILALHPPTHPSLSCVSRCVFLCVIVCLHTQEASQERAFIHSPSACCLVYKRGRGWGAERWRGG